MGGIATNYHGEVLTLAQRQSRYGGSRASGDRRSGFGFGSRRQPPWLQLAHRPGRVRPCRGHQMRRNRRGRFLASRPALGCRRSCLAPVSTGSVTPRAVRQRPNCACGCSAPCSRTAPVFRTGEVLEEGKKLIQDVVGGDRRCPRDRPVADMEHGPDRDARIRQSDRAGRGDRGRLQSTARKAAVPTPARTFPSATTRSG